MNRAAKDRLAPHSAAPDRRAHYLREAMRQPLVEATMGEVIHANFGTEREWEQTHEKTVDGLLTIGTLFGDDEALMRAKAECVYHILREIVEDIPSVQITTRMPDNLTEEQMTMLTESIRQAALKGIEVAMTHSVQVLMSSIYDLCTSKLKVRPS
jgi:hypothetical protein